LTFITPLSPSNKHSTCTQNKNVFENVIVGISTSQQQQQKMLNCSDCCKREIRREKIIGNEIRKKNRLEEESVTQVLYLKKKTWLRSQLVGHA